MAKEFVDLEDLFFFLKGDPYVYPQYRSLKHGDKTRTDKQLKRAVITNLAWAEKLVPKMICQAYAAAMALQERIEKNHSYGGLDAWA